MIPMLTGHIMYLICHKKYIIIQVSYDTYKTISCDEFNLVFEDKQISDINSIVYREYNLLD